MAFYWLPFILLMLKLSHQLKIFLDILIYSFVKFQSTSFDQIMWNDTRWNIEKEKLVGTCVMSRYSFVFVLDCIFSLGGKTEKEKLFLSDLIKKYWCPSPYLCINKSTNIFDWFRKHLLADTNMAGPTLSTGHLKETSLLLSSFPDWTQDLICATEVALYLWRPTCA